MDPHTAVASAVYQNYRHETGDDTPTLIASTASPYKFPGVVVEAITGEPVADDFEAVSQLKQLSRGTTKSCDRIAKRKGSAPSACENGRYADSC